MSLRIFFNPWVLWGCYLGQSVMGKVFYLRNKQTNKLVLEYNRWWASLVAETVKNLPAMQDTQVQSLGWGDPLQKGMATCSSILAPKILCTEELHRLQSMGLQRVGHDWATNTHAHTNTHIIGDTSSISGSGRSPGGGNGNPLQYSCLENPMDRGAWWAIDHGVTEGWTWPRDWTCMHNYLTMMC